MSAPLGTPLRQSPRARPAGRQLLRLTALPFAASWVYWAVGFVADFDRFAWWTSAAQAFSLYAFGSTAIGLLLAVVLRDRPIAILAAVGIIVTAALHADRVRADAQPVVVNPTTVTVMALNLNQGRASASGVMELVRRERVDILVLPELTPPASEALSRLGLSKKLPNFRLNPWWGSGGLGIYSRYPLRDPSPMVEGASKRLKASAAVGSSTLTIYAIHAVPPRASLASPFRQDQANYPAPTSPQGGTVLAGDFNATLSDGRMRALLSRGYRDAAEQMGGALVPTWRRGLAALTIDHVLVSNQLTLASFKVHAVDGTDHRAVVSTILVPKT